MTIEKTAVDRLACWVDAPVGKTQLEALEHLRRCAEVAFSRLEAPADVPAERAARTFFRDVRFCFPLGCQAAAWQLILEACRAIERRDAKRALARREARRCPVLTRVGTPCRRDPLPNGWCPSHQHLVEERFTRMVAVAGAAS